MKLKVWYYGETVLCSQIIKLMSDGDSRLIVDELAKENDIPISEIKFKIEEVEE